MQKSTSLAWLSAALLAFGVAVPAQAALIDFTDGLWFSDPADPTHTRSFGSLDVTLTAYDTDGIVPFTQTDFDGTTSGLAECTGLGLACDKDGIGIDDDEVTFGIERLHVGFSEPVDLVSIILLDLFEDSPSDRAAPEVAQVQFQGSGATGAFTGIADDDGTGLFVGMPSNASTAGNLDVTSNWFGLTEIEFFANDFGSLPGSSNTDFALAGLDVKLVPVPPALPLLGTALVALVIVGRRRKGATWTAK